MTFMNVLANFVKDDTACVYQLQIKDHSKLLSRHAFYVKLL